MILTEWDGLETELCINEYRSNVPATNAARKWFVGAPTKQLFVGERTRKSIRADAARHTVGRI
jgi:hypothetical protein